MAKSFWAVSGVSTKPGLITLTVMPRKFEIDFKAFGKIDKGRLGGAIGGSFRQANKPATEAIQATWPGGVEHARQ